MKCTAFILALCALSQAQTKPEIRLPADTRLYEPKNLSGDRAHSVAISVHNIMGNVALDWDGVAHAFVIHAGDPKVLDLAEALLKRYDVPLPNVQLTVYLIRTSNSAPSANLPTGPVPPEVKSAVDEMKGAFNYQSYALWDAISVPIKTRGEVQGALPASPNSVPSVYTIAYSTANPPGPDRMLSFGEFLFSLKFPDGVDSRIKSDLTIREGQKLVLGKIRVPGAGNADLFLVLTAKFE